MTSPGACGTMASPVFTPAVLQNEPPPWAHPTPSPSPMFRCPPDPTPSEPDADFSANERPGSPLPADLVWEICMPFIQQMLEALHEAMQNEIRTQVFRVMAQAQSVGEHRLCAGSLRTRASGASPLPPEKRSPFSSLLSSSSHGGDRGTCRISARNLSPGPVLREEGESDVCSSEAEGGTDVPRTEDAMQTQTVFARSSAPSEVVQTGRRNFSGCDQQPSSFSLPASSPEALLRGIPPSSAGWPNSASNMPMKVTPTVSPLVPTIDPSRFSPLLSATETGKLAGIDEWQECSTASAAVCFGTLMATSIPASSTGLALGSLQGMSVSSPDQADKVVMVCRHWKSKGYCRRAEECKFLHPDHKRGTTSVRLGNSSNVNGASGTGQVGASTAEGTDLAVEGGAPGSSRTRRAGRRSRRGGSGVSQVSVDAVAVTPGLVSTGTTQAPVNV